MTTSTDHPAWPELDAARLAATRDSVHRWTQVIGKVKARAVPVPQPVVGGRPDADRAGADDRPDPVRDESFEIDLDLVAPSARRAHDRGRRARGAAAPAARGRLLRRRPGAPGRPRDPGRDLPRARRRWAQTAPLDEDTEHTAYDPAVIHAWWRAVVAIERVMQRFRTPFHGKSSPVVVFWGGFDLAHQRFSGRPAPPRDGAGPILEFGEDQENFAIGFWTGTPQMPPLLYAYVVPKPDDLERAAVRPGAARWDEALGEFVLPYDELRRSASPEADLLAFFRSTYRASASLRRVGPRRARRARADPARAGRRGLGRALSASRRGGAAGGRRRSR